MGVAQPGTVVINGPGGRGRATLQRRLSQLTTPPRRLSEMANVSSALRGIAALPNGTTYRNKLPCAICAPTAFALGIASYVCGSRHGFDRWMPEPIEYENMKIAVALSERYYGLERGGLILKPVVECIAGQWDDPVPVIPTRSG